MGVMMISSSCMQMFISCGREKSRVNHPLGGGMMHFCVHGSDMVVDSLYVYCSFHGLDSEEVNY